VVPSGMQGPISQAMPTAWAVARATLLGLGSVTTLVLSSPFVHAQEVRFRHQAGLYLPTSFSIQDGVLHVKQRVGLKVAGAVSFIFSKRFAVVAGASYIPGYALIHGAGKRFDVATSSHVFRVSTGARYWLIPEERKFSVQLQTGLGVSAGGQTAYEDLFDHSILSGSIGTVLRYQIGRILRLQMGIHERLYRLRLGGGDPGRAGKPLRVTFGVTFPFLELGSRESNNWR
jgi:hypothetical protein